MAHSIDPTDDQDPLLRQIADLWAALQTRLTLLIHETATLRAQRDEARQALAALTATPLPGPDPVPEPEPVRYDRIGRVIRKKIVKPRRCECGLIFVPGGPRQVDCDACRSAAGRPPRKGVAQPQLQPPPPVTRPAPSRPSSTPSTSHRVINGVEYEVAWSGREGLTNGGGSSLHPGNTYRY